MATKRRLSRKGARFIARFEGFSATPYQDSVGVWTIGYGHTTGVGPNTRSVSKRKARKLLRQDAQVACDGVRRATTVNLTQTQLDALISFAFNLGVGAYQTSTLRATINSHGSPSAIKDQFMRWVYAGSTRLPGLVTRRHAEARLFNHGKYR